MAPFRGRGGSSRGNRGGSRGGGRGARRGGADAGGRLARSGIKTKHGYRKFDSQRVKDVESEEDPVGEEEEYEEELADVGDDEEIEIKPTVKAYNALMQSFQKSEANGERQAKRRKVEATTAAATSYHEVLSDDSSTLGHDEEEEENEEQEEDDEGDDEEAEMDARESSNRDVGGDDEDEEASLEDPFEAHFANPDNNELSMRCQAIQSNEWKAEKQSLDRHTNATVHSPVCVVPSTLRKGVSTVKELPLKERLLRNVEQHFSIGNPLEQSLASYIFNYVDVLFGNRNTRNAASLRNLASLHAVNHILKGRDKVLKNNERIKHAPDGDDLECRDQGFTRPKVLILAETRQMAASYANAIASAFQPEQQENRKRFDDSFTAPLDERETMPEDYRELFGGNNDNSFLTALKFTRKTIKFYSAFYNSDIILASPLGLRRIIENEDVKKRDYDFLSSIEVIIADQADAMQMQNWENVEVVFKHLNLELKESHGCDFNRVRNYYLDGNARYLRQTILFSAYITPEINRLYNTSMLNMAGKAKFTSTYAGAITDTSGLGMKQTFSRFDSGSPMADPEARFKYFTTAILPRLLRLPKPADGAAGILVFIPTYFDFLRLRNYFATSSQTENISFGTIHDYSEVSDQRRARSHFLNGRHSILLYTQRAHHFFRLKIRGVKRVVMYGLPDNPTFYRELIEGYLGTSIAEGKMDPAESSVRSAFSKWDGLRLERIVGTERVKGMLGGVGDTFDFI